MLKAYKIKLSSYVEAVAASNGQTSSHVLNEAVAEAQSQLKKEEQDVEQYLSDVVQVQVIQHTSGSRFLEDLLFCFSLFVLSCSN